MLLNKRRFFRVGRAGPSSLMMIRLVVVVVVVVFELENVGRLFGLLGRAVLHALMPGIELGYDGRRAGLIA